MTTCQKATQLIVKSSELKLSLGEKIALKFHLMFCKACKLFETQNEEMDKAFSDKNALQETTVLSDSKKNELEELMKNELKG